MKVVFNDAAPATIHLPSDMTYHCGIIVLLREMHSVVLRSGYLVATKMRLAVGDRCLLTTILHAC